MTLFSSHVSFEQLLNLAEGRLSPDIVTAAHTHIAGCERCARELAHIERLINLMRTDDSEDAPDSVIARIVRLFPRTPSEPSPLRRVLAALSFESEQLQSAYGMRSGHPITRQMVFNAEDHALHLRIAPAGTQWEIMGQVLGSTTSSGEVELRSSFDVVRAELNNLSEFALPLVPAGTYVLEVRIGDVAIEVADLDLGY